MILNLKICAGLSIERKGVLNDKELPEELYPYIRHKEHAICICNRETDKIISHRENGDDYFIDLYFCDDLDVYEKYILSCRIRAYTLRNYLKTVISEREFYMSYNIFRFHASSFALCNEFMTGLINSNVLLEHNEYFRDIIAQEKISQGIVQNVKNIDILRTLIESQYIKPRTLPCLNTSFCNTSFTARELINMGFKVSNKTFHDYYTSKTYAGKTDDCMSIFEHLINLLFNLNSKDVAAITSIFFIHDIADQPIMRSIMNKYKLLFKDCFYIRDIIEEIGCNIGDAVHEVFDILIECRSDYWYQLDLYAAIQNRNYIMVGMLISKCSIRVDKFCLAYAIQNNDISMLEILVNNLQGPIVINEIIGESEDQDILKTLYRCIY